MASEFEPLLAELGDVEQPLVVSKLIGLSALSVAEAVAFGRWWPSVAVARRRVLVAELVEMAEDNIELDFSAVLRGCLDDGDAEVRRRALEGLWEIEDTSLIAPIVDLLARDPDATVRAAAALALGQFTLLAEFDKLAAVSAARVDAALMTAFDNRNEATEVRRRALEAISARSLDRVSAMIREAYASPAPEMRISAVYAMGRNCDDRWLPALITELRSVDTAMRFEAAGAAGELGDERAVSHLIVATDDVDAEVRLEAIGALGRIGGVEARRRLLQCATSDDESVRAAAQDALDEIDTGDDFFHLP